MNSYSDVVAHDINKQKKAPKLVIKRNSNEMSIDKVKKDITHILNKDTSIKIKQINAINEEEIIINCFNEGSIEKTMEILNEKLSNECAAEKIKMDNPKMKLVGTDNIDNMDDQTLENDINQRNFVNCINKCKVIHSYVNQKSKLTTAILDTSQHS